MRQYLDLLRTVRLHGRLKRSRAVTVSDGKKPDCLEIFGAQIRFDLADGFPAVTTKRLPFRSVAVELAWFLRGLTNVRWLQERGCKFWDQWADKDGELGPVYGHSWRRFGRNHADSGFDQISTVVRDIKAVVADPHHPAARRLIVTAWNPVDVENVPKAPPPCHTLFQFMVTDGRLDCQLYQRSADLFLGVPCNIASYALLIHLVARATGLQPGEFVHTFGSAHIYSNHFAQVDEQLDRKPYPLPRLLLDNRVGDAPVWEFEPQSVQLANYESHPALMGEVAV